MSTSDADESRTSTADENTDDGTVTVPPAFTGPNRHPTKIRFNATESLPMILERAQCSIIISTYLIGNVITVGTHAGRMVVEFHTLDRPMGMTAAREGVVICVRNQVWFMPALPDVRRRWSLRGKYDNAYFARKSMFTGNISCHETAWVGKELWIVNTRFSCLCTLHPTCHFAPRWKPPFITALAPEDRCHLNGMAVADGMARYATALAETDHRDGWRPTKTTSGCIIDIPNNTVVVRGFAMPHSPRLINGRLFVLHSGFGRVETIDVIHGKRDVVRELPGYVRGLSVHGPLAFVGLSKIRPTTTLDGVPLAERRDELKSGVWVIELASGAILGHIEFTMGIDELFDVQVIPGVVSPFLSGPLVDYYSDKTHWTMPPPT